MEPGPIPGENPASAGPARVGRRRLGARDGSAVDGEGRWPWLSPLGGEPIRLTPENVVVTMSVRWLGGLIVRGRFMDVRGTIHVPVRDDDTAAVTVEIRADSVRTGISLRDRHLRGPLFLDAARHPLGEPRLALERFLAPRFGRQVGKGRSGPVVVRQSGCHRDLS